MWAVLQESGIQDSRIKFIWTFKRGGCLFVQYMLFNYMYMYTIYKPIGEKNDLSY